MTARTEILQGDCLGLMKAMPDKSVAMVMTSPPYVDARTYGIGFKLRDEAYVEWAKPRFMECVRLSRGPVFWVIEGKTKDFRYDMTPVLLMADLHRAGVNFRKPPIFRRVGIPGSGGPDWIRNDYEFILAATPPSKLEWSDNTAMGHVPKWAPGGEMAHRLADGCRVNQWGPVGGNGSGATGRKQNGEHKNKKPRPSHKFMSMSSRGANGERKIAGGRSFAEKVEAGAKVHTKHDTEAEMREQAYLPPPMANPGNVIQQRYTAQWVAELLGEPSDVIDCLVGGGVMGDNIAHENEAPYPEDLCEFLIRSFCPPDGLCLDPFCGSGTTLKVALACGRRAMGIDLRESQVALSRRRIAEVQPELFT